MSAREDLDRLRQELAECIYTEDHEGVRRAYREMLRDGVSRQEVLDEVIRLATRTDQQLSEKLESPKVEPSPVVPEPNSYATPEATVPVAPPIAAEPVILGDPTQNPSQTPTAARHTSEEPSRRTPPFSRSRRVFVGISVAIALVVAPTGLVSLVRAPAGTQVAATALIPPPPIQEPVPQQLMGPPAATTGTPASITPQTAPSPPVVAQAPAALSAPATPSMPEDSQPKDTPKNKLSAVDAAASSAPVSTGTPVLQENAKENANGFSKEARAELLARGDVRFATGDIASARLFYEGAANAGEAQAALRLGQTYDPSFLAFTRFTRVRGDPASAAYWYLRADKLGSTDAQGLLRALARDVGVSAPSQPNR